MRATVLLMLLVAQVASGAGSLRVAPTRIDLKPDQRAVVVTVQNTGSLPTLLQLETKRWSQESGTDDYASSTDLIVSPPIFTLNPGSEQLVRIGRRNATPVANELAWRLFIQEVPTPGITAPRELNVVLRIGVPVFATPTEAPEGKLEWRLECLDLVPPLLLASNHGGRAVRIDEVKVRASGSEQVDRAVYVLAGATRTLTLVDLPAATRKVDLASRGNQDTFEGSAACN